MSRIDEKFKELRREGKKGFIAYLCAGDPEMETTYTLSRELGKRGIDILELGVPFSDPIADGPTIQKASERALRWGTSLPDILALVKRLREEVSFPIVLLSYYNPIYRYGIERFVNDSREAGVDGVIVPDLPLEEGEALKTASQQKGLDMIFLLSPTSSRERIRLISRSSSGFIYYVSLTGITGARTNLAKGIRDKIAEIRAITNKPVAIGFGVSTPAQARQAAEWVDAVIVGSAIIDVVERHLNQPDLISAVGDFTNHLINAIKNQNLSEG